MSATEVFLLAQLTISISIMGYMIKQYYNYTKTSKEIEELFLKLKNDSDWVITEVDEETKEIIKNNKK